MIERLAATYRALAIQAPAVAPERLADAVAGSQPAVAGSWSPIAQQPFVDQIHVMVRAVGETDPLDRVGQEPATRLRLDRPAAAP
jgi:hypothetical protein